MLPRPIGMRDGARGEQLLLSALACEMRSAADAQEMVRCLLAEIVAAEDRITGLQSRVRQLEWDALPTEQEAMEAWLADRFFEVGHTAYAFWMASETPEALYKAVGDCVRRMDAPEAER